MIGQFDNLPNDTVFKKRYRWMTRFKRGDEVLFEGFAKLGSRPTLDENEINFLSHKTWIPGKVSWEEITINHWGLTDEILEKWQKAVRDLDMVELILYDGCGARLETWTVHAARTARTNVDSWLTGDDPYPHNTELTIRYSRAEFASEKEIPGLEPPV